jgi:hypothetical protein
MLQKHDLSEHEIGGLFHYIIDDLLKVEINLDEALEKISLYYNVEIEYIMEKLKIYGSDYANSNPVYGYINGKKVKKNTVFKDCRRLFYTKLKRLTQLEDICELSYQDLRDSLENAFKLVEKKRMFII